MATTSTPLWLQPCVTESLPVCELSSTARALALTLAPVLPSANQFRDSVLNILSFLQDDGGEQSGPALQRKLLAHAASCNAQGLSWLINWWNRLSYTSWRLPLPLNVSYWYLFNADAFRALDRDCHEPTHRSSYRAAALVLAAASARDALWGGSFPVDRSGGRPCDTRMMRYIFHACRFPRHTDDGIRVYDGSYLTAPGDFIVVMRRGRPFVVSLESSSSTGGGRASVAEFAHRLRTVSAFADSSPNPSFAAVGVLTGAHRDTWAAALPLLAGASATERPSHGANIASNPALELWERDDATATPAQARNLACLTTIEASLLVLCLDHSPQPPPSSGGSRTTASASRTLLDGSAPNRWYDKAVQFVVSDDGGCIGMIGEHSHCDGMPTAHVLDVMFQQLQQQQTPRAQQQLNPPTSAAATGHGSAIAQRIAALSRGAPLGSRVLLPLLLSADTSTSTSSTSSGSSIVGRSLPPGTTELDFRLPENSATRSQLLQLFSRAEAEVFRQAAAHELHVVSSSGYGAADVKKFGVSPDAWAQMAMQLAHYYWRGCFVPTYEPAHARRFVWGRTACIRVVTAESCAWAVSAAKAAKSSSGTAVSPEEARVLHSLLQRASAAHAANVRACLAGRDIDRHLLGLKMIWREGGAAAAAAVASTAAPPAATVTAVGGPPQPIAPAAPAAAAVQLSLPGARATISPTEQLFKDEGVAYSSAWRLSTSNLTAAWIENWGFGEVMDGGLGVAYSTGAKSLRFNVVGEKVTSPGDFAQCLDRALRDMFVVAAAATAASAAASSASKKA